MVGILAWAIARNPSIVDDHAMTLVKRLGEIDALASKPSRVVLFGEVVDRSAELWLQTREPGIDPFAGSPNIEVVMIEMEKHPFRFEGATGSDDRGFERFDGSAGVETVGPYRVHRRPYAIVEPSTWNGTTPVLAAWIPKFEAVSLSGDRVTAALKEAGIPFSTVHHRYQAKVNVFDRLSQVYVPFDAPMQERNKATMDALMAVSGRFGGHVYLLIPQ
jgi:hypothetical protein